MEWCSAYWPPFMCAAALKHSTGYTTKQLHWHRLTATLRNSKGKQTAGCNVYYLHLTDRQIHVLVLVHTWRQCVREKEPNTCEHTSQTTSDVYHFIKTRYARARSNLTSFWSWTAWIEGKRRNNRADENHIHIHVMRLTKKSANQILLFKAFSI